MEHPSALAQTLSEDLERQYEDGRQLCELRGLPSEDREDPCEERRHLSMYLGLSYEHRRLSSLFGGHPDVFVGDALRMPTDAVAIPTDAL